LSKKGSSSNNHITLSENGEIINDPAKVSEVFNDFFINVAKNIGNTNVIVNKEHQFTFDLFFKNLLWNILFL
jgi:archaellum component FlaG (FlaF/FlaG flagellin family)